MKIKAFTLIELLIVVAIIAILAAIAVPNFLEAQTRAKVTRTVADMRTIAIGIESYAVDANRIPREYHLAWGDPPIDRNGVDEDVFGIIGPWLSTPISYLSNAYNVDPFSEIADLPEDYYYRYQDLPTRLDQTKGPTFSVAFSTLAIEFYGNWRLISQGPDGSFAHGNGAILNSAQLVYDATNGTVSEGNIFRSQRHSEPRQPAVGSPGLLGPH
ncbi:MAG: prepilin-type N-terminal cleavage/methylation domain-containing protein [Sumerlaeia bacterium]